MDWRSDCFIRHTENYLFLLLCSWYHLHASTWWYPVECHLICSKYLLSATTSSTRFLHQRETWTKVNRAASHSHLSTLRRTDQSFKGDRNWITGSKGTQMSVFGALPKYAIQSSLRAGKICSSSFERLTTMLNRANAMQFTIRLLSVEPGRWVDASRSYVLITSSPSW